jgi:citrate lyase subunit beta/citryl-CoA lyase
MTDRPRRARRVQLSTPGSSEKMMQKASESKADHVFLDLEDAVAPSQKRDARKKIVQALKTLNWTGKTRCVRINDLTTEYAFEDIIEVVEGAGEHLDTIMMTKVMTPADILFADKLLHQLEKKLKLKNRIGLEALIEEVEGMQNVDAIAKSTPRLECLVFGMGDFSASMGVTNKNVGETDGYPGDIWHYARFRLIMACRAAGIDPVDGPFADFKNPDAYREECRRSMIRAALASGRSIPRRSSMRWSSTRRSPKMSRGQESSRRPMPRPRPRAWAPSTSTASWSTSPRSASCATRS